MGASRLGRFIILVFLPKVDAPYLICVGVCAWAGNMFRGITTEALRAQS
jgi:hypothetical protein